MHNNHERFCWSSALGGTGPSKKIREGGAKNLSYGKISSIQDYSPNMGQSVHFIKDLGSGHEGGDKFKIRPGW